MLEQLHLSQKPIIKWWGAQHFDLNQSRIWQMGSLQIKITRHLTEWRLEYYRPEIQYDYEQDFREILDTAYQLPQPSQVNRFMFKHTEPTLHLMPRLAPRSIVIKPVEPIYVASGQSAMLYISTPLWLRAYIHRAEQPLFELPIMRPKETWFGENKREGQICYVTSVDGRTELDALVLRAFRAVTPVFVQNVSTRPLHFERMNIPVTALPLFYSESSGRLVTSLIRVNYDGDQNPRIKIEQRSPDFAGQVENIHSEHEQTTLFKMFELF